MFGVVDLRVAAQVADPVVEVVDGDEEDVGLGRRGLRHGDLGERQRQDDDQGRRDGDSGSELS